jgi:hypothetical protein
MLTKESSCISPKSTLLGWDKNLALGLNTLFLAFSVTVGLYDHNLLLLMQSVLILQLFLWSWLNTQISETENVPALILKQLCSETLVGLLGSVLLVLLLIQPLTGNPHPHDTFTIVMLIINWVISYWRFVPAHSPLTRQLLHSEYRAQYPFHGGLMVFSICHWYFPAAAWNTSLVIAGWGCFIGMSWILWLDIYEEFRQERT